MPKPTNFMKGKHFANNATKAPKLPGTKKKKSRVEAEDGDGQRNDRQEQPRRGGVGGGGDKRSKKSQRSPLGFIVATAACVALWGWRIFEGVEKKKRDRRTLDSMRRKPMFFSEHAACRMDCRFVTKQHVEDTLQKGTINDRKSEPKLRPCPKYVVDAHLSTPDGRDKAVQAVFSACRSETRVVTVIDTHTNWPCGPC